MTVTDAPPASTKSGPVATLGRWFALHGRGLLAALLIAGLTVPLYLGLRSDEGVMIYRLAEVQAPRVRTDLIEGLRNRLLALRALGGRWESQPAGEARRKADADSLLRLELQFRGLQWLDPSLDIRWTMPPGARLPGAPLDSAHDAIRIEELRALLTEPDPTVSRSFPLPDAPRQLLMCAPVREQGRVTGYLVGVMRATDVIDAIVRQPVQRGWSIQITEGVFQVYGPTWLEGGDEAAYGNEAFLKVGDLDWKAMVWPSVDLAANLRSGLVPLVLALGIVLAIVVGWLVDRLSRSRARVPVAAASAPRAEEAGILVEPRETPGPI